MCRHCLEVIALVCFLAHTTVSAAKELVQVGGDASVDACSTVAMVAHLSDGPDGFLAVKEAPNLKAKRIDKIYNGQSVWVCDSSKDGQWFGVVYSKKDGAECNVAQPVEKRKSYSGPCSSGWVSKKYISLIAG